MRSLGTVGRGQRDAGGRTASARVYLATVRCIADELDRCLGEVTPGPKSCLREQLADELERLARVLRENDPTADG
jgi:hypothetical protein